MLFKETSLEQSFRDNIGRRITPTQQATLFSWNDSYVKPILIMRPKWLEPLEMTGTTCNANATVSVNKKPDTHSLYYTLRSAN